MPRAILKNCERHGRRFKNKAVQDSPFFFPDGRGITSGMADEQTTAEASRSLQERRAERQARKIGASLAKRLDRPVVLVGMPGAGKSRTGILLAHSLKVPFFDTDQEIERAAGCTVAEIFARDGEQAFRTAEARLMGRLLSHEGVCVIATGGGTVMNPEVWSRVLDAAMAVWIRADMSLLVSRTEGRAERPLLAQGDVRARLEGLQALREPVYARASFHVESRETPTVETVLDILEKLAERFP